MSKSTPLITHVLNPIVCSRGKPAHTGFPLPPHMHTLHLNNRMPGADGCYGIQELRRDRCDEDELIPFLREWNKLFKTNNQALSQADTYSTVGLKDETLM
jgi:hypothetical protein